MFRELSVAFLIACAASAACAGERKVAFALRELPAGTVLVREMGELRAPPAGMPLPEDALLITDLTELSDRVVARRILAGEMILRTRLDGGDPGWRESGPAAPVVRTRSSAAAPAARPLTDVDVGMEALAVRRPVVVLRGALRTTEWPEGQPPPPIVTPSKVNGYMLEEVLEHIQAVHVDPVPEPHADDASLQLERGAGP